MNECVFFMSGETSNRSTSHLKRCVAGEPTNNINHLFTISKLWRGIGTLRGVERTLPQAPVYLFPLGGYTDATNKPHFSLVVKEQRVIPGYAAGGISTQIIVPFETVLTQPSQHSKSYRPARLRLQTAPLLHLSVRKWTLRSSN